MEGQDLSGWFRALAFVGSVKAVRQEYAVFRTAGGDFMVFSPSSRSPSSYHVTLVPGERVRALRKVVGGSEVTSNSVLKDARVGGIFGRDRSPSLRFEVLMSLYVMVAEGRLEMGRAGRSLTFKPRPPQRNAAGYGCV